MKIEPKILKVLYFTYTNVGSQADISHRSNLSTNSTFARGSTVQHPTLHPSARCAGMWKWCAVDLGRTRQLSFRLLSRVGGSANDAGPPAAVEDQGMPEEPRPSSSGAVAGEVGADGAATKSLLGACAAKIRAGKSKLGEGAESRGAAAGGAVGGTAPMRRGSVAEAKEAGW